MVVQLRCLKAVPRLTGHENAPSAHFGHRALQIFNWTITHEEKKQKTNHIIELLSASARATKSYGFSCFRCCSSGGLFARRVQVAMTPVPMCCGWILSLGHTQRLSARRSCFLACRAACPGLQSPGNYNAAKQKTGAGFGLAFAHRWPPANSHHDWKPGRTDVGCGFRTHLRALTFQSRKKTTNVPYFVVPFLKIWNMYILSLGSCSQLFLH